MKRWFWALPLAALACGSSAPPPPVAKKPVTKPTPVPELAEPPPQETYVYSPIGEARPFPQPHR